jgi:hypothetical protein
MQGYNLSVPAVWQTILNSKFRFSYRKHSNREQKILLLQENKSVDELRNL